MNREQKLFLKTVRDVVLAFLAAVLIVTFTFGCGAVYEVPCDPSWLDGCGADDAPLPSEWIT